MKEKRIPPGRNVCDYVCVEVDEERTGKGRQVEGSRVESLFNQVLRDTYGSAQWRQGWKS